MPVFGWGQASDGHNVAISHPEGRGLRDAMVNALKRMLKFLLPCRLC